MNGLDITLIIVFIALTLFGIFKGLIRIALSWASVIFAYLGASWFYPLVSKLFSGYISDPGMRDILAFTLIFLIIVLIGILVIWILRDMLKKLHMLWVDRLAGGVLGFFLGLALCTVILILITVNFSPESSLIRDSILAPHTLNLAREVIKIVPGRLKKDFERKRKKFYKYWQDPEGKENVGTGPAKSDAS